MIIDSDITVIILAGGKSSRMGQDKGLMLVNEKPMIQHVLEVAKQITSQIIIVANNSGYKQFGFPVYKDDFQDKGPLSGIYTGLKNSTTLYNLVLSCDIPFIQKDLLVFLLSSSQGNEITVSLQDGKLHPLIAVYTKNCESSMLEKIQRNELKVVGIFDRLNTKQIDVSRFDSSNFRNINKESDL